MLAMPIADKREWRRSLAAARELLTAGEREARSQRLCERLAERVVAPLRDRFGRALHLCVYAAFRSEASPAALFGPLAAAGDRLYAPRMMPGGGGLELRRVTRAEDWIPGRWGVPEPNPATTEARDDRQAMDLVLVPGLAFNAAGARLGYGGGFYDRLYGRERLLGHTATLWFGFAFAMQLVGEPLPVEPHDLRLDGLATERDVIWFTKGEAAGYDGGSADAF